MSDRGDHLDIEIISEPIGLAVVKSMAEQQFGDMIKAVVDVEGSNGAGRRAPR